MTISAAAFKQQCLRLMEDVRRTHKAITITKRGKPVARLCSATPARRPRLLGYLKGQMIIRGNIVSPIRTKWTYDADHV